MAVAPGTAAGPWNNSEESEKFMEVTWGDVIAEEESAEPIPCPVQRKKNRQILWEDVLKSGFRKL